VTHHLNGSNQRDTGHSSEGSRMTVQADEQPYAGGNRQQLGQSRHSIFQISAIKTTH
jgi:hypothetical protein